MEYSQLKQCVANYGDKAFTNHTYAICNEFGLVAIVYANHEQDALDEAVDRGLLDSDIMSDEDHAECLSEGWEDCFTYAGNAGEPIWTTYLSIKEIK